LGTVRSTIRYIFGWTIIGTNFFFGRAGNAAEAEICGKSYSKRLVMWKLDVNEIPLNMTRESYDTYSIK
jgi:hypothetical protein